MAIEIETDFGAEPACRKIEIALGRETAAEKPALKLRNPQPLPIQLPFKDEFGGLDAGQVDRFNPYGCSHRSKGKSIFQSVAYQKALKISDKLQLRLPPSETKTGKAFELAHAISQSSQGKIPGHSDIERPLPGNMDLKVKIHLAYIGFQ